VLAIWYDVAGGMNDEFDDWMTAEHMPERVDMPGFVRGRRYRSCSGRYLTLYDLEDAAVLTSSAYRASAAAPSEWTQRMLPHFRDIDRRAYAVVDRAGRGTAGRLVTATVADGAEGATAASLVEHGRTPAAAILRPSTAIAPVNDDWLVLVDALDPELAARSVGDAFGTRAVVQQYELMYTL
jgi:hypothetical protein